LTVDNNFESIHENTVYSTKLVITEELLKAFGELSGDYNPLHIDDAYAKEKGFTGKVAYGNILGLLISQLVGMNLWSKEVMLISQKINFNKPIYTGNFIELTGKITQKSSALKVVELSLSFANDEGDIVASGKCHVRCL
jgi:3-hydroxybutyryl-CoA dehydratase